MDRRTSSSEWVAVDRSADPTAFVGYLDAAHGHEAIRAFKQASFAMLELQPSDRVLDVGCGAGDDARALARLVAPGGSAVGIDASATMVDEARRRSDGLDLPVEFRVGDAHRLDLADEAFDGARTERVLQHLAEPEWALAELVRVAKRGGRVVVVEPDWGSLVVDAPDRETTAAVLAAIVGRFRNPWMGRQLFGLFRRAGLEEVSIPAGVALFTDYARAETLFRFGEAISQARAGGAVTAEAAANWRQGLEEAVAADQFCCAMTGFIVAGRRP